MVRPEKESQMMRTKRMIGKHTVRGVSIDGLRWWIDNRRYSLLELFAAFPTDAPMFLTLMLSPSRVEGIRHAHPELFPAQAGRSARSPECDAGDAQWVKDAVAIQDERWNAIPRPQGPVRPATRPLNGRRVRHVR